MKEKDATQMTPQNSFWVGRKVFITGASGFIGSHLSNRLFALGANIGAFIHKNECSRSYVRHYGDLKEHSAALKPFLMGFNPEVVFHLASQPLVSRAAEDEVETLETNIGGTFRVLHAVKDVPALKSFVHISTDKVYGDASPITMHTKMDGVKHPYNASKQASDTIAQMYSNFFDVPMVIIRNANVYGAGDRHLDRIIPRTIYMVLNGENPIIRGDGQNTRDYIHVDDLVEGYIKAAELPRKKKLSIVNMGGYNYSTLQVINWVLKKAKRIDLAPTFESQWKGEIPHQHIVNDSAFEFFDWLPHIDLSEGLDRTIPWYQEKYGNR